MAKAKASTVAVAPVAVAPVAVAPVAQRDTKNGVTRPSQGSTTGRIWAIADEISAATGAPAVRKAVLLQAVSEGINPATCATQFGRWYSYNGLTPVKVAPIAPKAKKSVEVAVASDTSVINSNEYCAHEEPEELEEDGVDFGEDAED